MPDSNHLEADNAWPALPTETEIYILPSGEIVVADLPVELAASLAQLSQLAASNYAIEIVESTDPNHVTDQQHPTQPT